MAPIKPLSNGSRWDKVIQYLISAIYVMFPLVYLVYALETGGRVDMMFWVIIIGYSIVSAYKVWGKKEVDAALNKAEEVTGQNGENNNE